MSIRITAVATLALVLTPLAVRAQEAAPAPAAAPPSPAAEAANPSAKEIAGRIQKIQQQALQDPELRADNQAITALINATMVRLDPEYPNYVKRAQTLQADVAAARAASDNARLKELAEEAKQLQANVTAAQTRAKEDAAVKQKLDEYKVKLFTKMVGIDPTVEALVKQLETLQAQPGSSS
jgi:DNA repair exonuclease SbcCD ATPase subunit